MFLNLPFSYGDSVMTDKGFAVENIPPFLGMSDQMAAEDMIAIKGMVNQMLYNMQDPIISA